MGRLRWDGFLGGLNPGFHRANEDVGVAPLETGNALYATVRGEVFGEPHEEFLAEIGMSDFAAPELNHSLDSIAFLEEANGVVLFEVVIVVVGVGAELEFLDLHDVLLLAGVVLLLFLLVLIVAVVDGLGYGRHGGGGHQNQIEPQLLRSPDCGGRGHDLRRTVRKYGTDFPGANQLIHVLSAVRPSGREISARIHENYAATSEERTGWGWVPVRVGQTDETKIIQSKRN